MSYLITGITGILSGIAGSLGIGGGGILILFLTVFANVPQLKAQGINLAFFIPTGIFSVIMYRKQIKWKIILPVILGGVAGAFAGMYITTLITETLLQKIFAVILILLALKEFFKRKDA